MVRILINDVLKKHLLQQSPEYRRKVHQKFEYLEIGYWDGGLKVKKIKGLQGNKAVFEARLDRANRILFTLGRENGDASTQCLLIYVWGIVGHDRVMNKSISIIPENVPFLRFKSDYEQEIAGAQLEDMENDYVTQEGIAQRVTDDSAAQKWHFIEDEMWQRIESYEQDEFELMLHLTPEQRDILNKPLPMLISGTAGSGKTTLGTYYLLKLPLAKKKKLFITYNHYLKNAARDLYYGLLNGHPLRNEYHHPDFFSFKEFCLGVMGKHHKEFQAEKEVSYERFNELIQSNVNASRFDTALIWEEIRSIIKGAIPQINVTILKKAIEDIKANNLSRALLTALRQQFLVLARLRSLEKAEKYTQKYLHADLRSFCGNMDQYIENRTDRLLSALDRIVNFLLAERNLTQRKHLAFVDYEALGEKKAPNFQHDRKSIYHIFEWYQDKLNSQGLWDELDLTREAINLLGQNKLADERYDMVVCDEVQDLTDIQHELLFYLVRNPINLLFSGDTKQVINPSGFRWEELRRHYYERDLQTPDFHYLTLNFRSSGNIVELSNHLLDLKVRWIGSRSEEKREDWKYKGRPPVVVEGPGNQVMLENIRSTAATKTILVRSEQEKKALKRHLETELVFTINEAKGLEFDTVLLWKFASDVHASDLWHVILQESSRDFHQARIKHEINLLYVAITRAQKDLIIYDGEKPSVIWNSDEVRDNIIITDDLHYVADIWNVVSTTEEWLEQGQYFFDHEFYKAAMECFKNAGKEDLFLKAKAFDAEKRSDSRVAATCFEKIRQFEKAAIHYQAFNNYEKAYELWQALKNKEKAFQCQLKLLEQEEKFGELAELYLTRKDYQKAIVFLVKASEFDKAAEISLRRMGNKQDAAHYYELALQFGKAAGLYRRLNELEKAAILYEKAQDEVRAERLWKQLRRNDRLMLLYERTQEHEKLLQMLEKSKDFDQAIKVLKKIPPKGGLAKRAKELYDRQKYFPALIRYFAVNDHLGTAKSYLKLKNYLEAGRFFERVGEYFDAGVAFEKAENYQRALANCLESEQDQKNHFRRARRVAKRVSPSVVNDLGISYYKRNRFDIAAFCFVIIHNYIDAGACYLKAGQPERAEDQWSECLSDMITLETLARHCISHDLVEPGARFLLSQSSERISRAYWNYWDEFDLPVSLFSMMDSYFGNHPDREEMLKWVDILDSFSLSEEILNQKLKYLGKSGEYNRFFVEVKQLGYYSPKALKDLKRRFRRELKERDDTSDINAIKLFFLNRMDEFNNMVAGLELTESNYEIFAVSNESDKALDMMLERGGITNVKMILVQRNEFLKMATLFEKHGYLSKSAHYYGVAQKHEKSGAMFEALGKFSKSGEAYFKAKNYPKALEMYLLTGKNTSKIAAIHEKLGNYADAAAIWKALGKHRKAEKCAAKTGHQIALDL